MNRWWLAAPIIIVLSLAVFAGLVVYGWTHRHGPPATFRAQPFPTLPVPLRSESLAMEPDDLTASLWDELPAVQVNLLHQVTEKPWPKGHVPNATVQAFYNGKEIYFRIQWQDDRADAAVATGRFPDACAIAFPIEPGAPTQSIMMGFSSLVNIWHWRADVDAQFWNNAQTALSAYVDHYYPFEQSEVIR